MGLLQWERGHFSNVGHDHKVKEEAYFSFSQSRKGPLTAGRMHFIMIPLQVLHYYFITDNVWFIHSLRKNDWYEVVPLFPIKLFMNSWMPKCTCRILKLNILCCKQNLRPWANNLPKGGKRYHRHMAADNIFHTLMGTFQHPFLLDSWKSSSCLLEWSGVFSVVALWVTFSDKINVAEAILPRAIKGDLGYNWRLMTTVIFFPPPKLLEG